MSPEQIEQTPRPLTRQELDEIELQAKNAEDIYGVVDARRKAKKIAGVDRSMRTIEVTSADGEVTTIPVAKIGAKPVARTIVPPDPAYLQAVRGRTR